MLKPVLPEELVRTVGELLESAGPPGQKVELSSN
jgi:hypothetical protein